MDQNQNINTEEPQVHTGTLTIENVMNGFFITTGIGTKMVASNESEAIKVIGQMFKPMLPAKGASATIRIEILT